jgi:hypothetical protein
VVPAVEVVVLATVVEVVDDVEVEVVVEDGDSPVVVTELVPSPVKRKSRRNTAAPTRRIPRIIMARSR